MQQEAQWIVDVVGAHHNAVKAETLGFEVLYEADLIVNLFEGYYPVELRECLLSQDGSNRIGQTVVPTTIRRWLKKD